MNSITPYTSLYSDLTEIMSPFKSLLSIKGRDDGVEFGQLVVPNICNNYGPMYFAKITRTK